jgi:D-3-phosphoglycerate dehydrogenase
VTFKILICDKIADEGIKMLEERGYEVTKCWALPKSEICTIVADYDALIVRSATKVTADLMADAKKLEALEKPAS